jgi:hypothetical protein
VVHIPDNESQKRASLDLVEAFNRYFDGRSVCANRCWTPALATRPFARKVATIGFSGTYTDDGAENEYTALLGKQSVRFKTTSAFDRGLSSNLAFALQED